MSNGILFCSVGTGNRQLPIETLLDPFRKTIRSRSWKRIILLPSLETVGEAEKIIGDMPDCPFDPIRPIPNPQDEGDPDSCFAHFNSVIQSYLDAGERPEEMVADLTRGTKAMSAGLVLAAIRHGIRELRYVDGDRDHTGQVRPGSERIRELATTVVTANRTLDQARMLFSRGNYEGCQRLLHEIVDSDSISPIAKSIRLLNSQAKIRSAWDRLDYVEASRLAEAACQDATTEEFRLWIRELAAPLAEEPCERANGLRKRIVDLYANGLRRLRDGHHEDATLRNYRIFELIGQIRLFDRGYDSSDLPIDDEAIQSFQEELIRKKSSTLSQNPKTGNWQAAREQVARLLKRFGDPLAKKLLDSANHGMNVQKSRNLSLLIHGFEVTSGSDPKPLRDAYQQAWNLIIEDQGAVNANQRLQWSMT